jgi:hypothetical protein
VRQDGWDASSEVGDNLVFEQREARLCVHMGRAGSVFERCSTAALKCSANSGSLKWVDVRVTLV